MFNYEKQRTACEHLENTTPERKTWNTKHLSTVGASSKTTNANKQIHNVVEQKDEYTRTLLTVWASSIVVICYVELLWLVYLLPLFVCSLCVMCYMYVCLTVGANHGNTSNTNSSHNNSNNTNIHNNNTINK